MSNENEPFSIEPKEELDIEDIDIIKNLFLKYIKDLGKKYDPIYINKTSGTISLVVWGCRVTHPSILLIYKYDGVGIRYYRRFTDHEGDCNTYTDIYIESDGRELVDLIYQ